MTGVQGRGVVLKGRSRYFTTMLRQHPNLSFDTGRRGVQRMERMERMERTYRKWHDGSNLPMHKYSTSTLESLPDELVRCWKMLEQVLILDIIHLNDHVFETLEQLLFKRQPQHRQYVGYARLLQLIFAAQCENPIA